jgi:threonylcarbamoyladenosine tRNA methylthiotransferase MtaB
MARVRFVTYGCKANQYDTQVLREALLRRGWDEGSEGAELVVVNTCTVTAEAGRKARQLIRRVARESPTTKVCVTGCLAESEPEILRELPNVDWVLGNGEAKRPIHFLRELGHEIDPEELGIPAGITEFSGHTRAFLKIQDGCDMACAFCIIPRVRGKSQSRPARELALEVERLLRAGHVEIVLCGIHIGHWGRDLGLELSDLLRELCAVEVRASDGSLVDWRLRLSSIEATEVTGPVLEVMREHPQRIAPHLHMPMQSGDDELLAAMNRWYSVAEYLEACDRIRELLDRPAFTADILVGFPGETDRSFENTLETARKAGFSRIHVFPFSARPGTAAFEMGAPPPPQITRERRARLSERAHELQAGYLATLSGAHDAIVLEGSSGLSGRYLKVRIPSERLPAGPLEGLCPVELEVELPASPERPGEAVEARLLGRPLGVARETSPHEPGIEAGAPA